MTINAAAPAYAAISPFVEWWIVPPPSIVARDYSNAGARRTQTTMAETSLLQPFIMARMSMMLSLPQSAVFMAAATSTMKTLSTRSG